VFQLVPIFLGDELLYMLELVGDYLWHFLDLPCLARPASNVVHPSLSRAAFCIEPLCKIALRMSLKGMLVCRRLSLGWTAAAAGQSMPAAAAALDWSTAAVCSIMAAMRSLMQGRLELAKAQLDCQASSPGDTRRSAEAQRHLTLR